MLEAFCKMLHGMASADEGVETVLSPIAYNGLIDLTIATYGHHAADVVQAHFMKHKATGGYYCPCEDLEEAFRLCLTGKG